MSIDYSLRYFLNRKSIQSVQQFSAEKFTSGKVHWQLARGHRQRSKKRKTNIFLSCYEYVWQSIFWFTYEHFTNIFSHNNFSFKINFLYIPKERELFSFGSVNRKLFPQLCIFFPFVFFPYILEFVFSKQYIVNIQTFPNIKLKKFQCKTK